MRLRTRQEIADEFRIPPGGVDSRMAVLGCLPTRHKTKGRGYHVLYDAGEVSLSIQSEREQEKARAKKSRARYIAKQPDNFFSLPWSKAKLLLTGGGPSQ